MWNKVWIFMLASSLLPAMAADGLVELASVGSVEATEARLLKALDKNGLQVMKVIDHAGAAHKVGMQLPATRVVIFGNPKLGTRLMHCAPTVAIDLPLKILIWQDGDQTRLAYNDPAVLNQRHGLAACQPLVDKMSGMLSKLASDVSQER